MATPKGSQTLWRANLIVACGTALSRVTGLIRIIIFGVMIGQTALADAYDAANNAPNVVYELLLGGVLAASLVPLFTRYIQDGDDDSVNAISSFAVVALATITTLALLASPLIFRVFSLNTSSEINVALFRSTGTSLTRLFIIQIFFYGLTAIASAILNSKRRFFAAAWTPVIANLVTIFTLLAIPRVTSIKPPTISEVSLNRSLQLLLGLGSTSGIIAMTLFMVIALTRSGVRLKWNFDLNHPAVKKLLKLSGWAVGYVVANQISLIVIKNLASPGSGNVDAYSKAYTFFSLPHGLLAVSIATTFVPDLARAATNLDLAKFHEKFIAGIRLTALVTIPAAFGMFVLARPLVAMLLQHGNFNSLASQNTARALSGFAIGLAGFSVYLFVLRGFYTNSDTRTPFWINLFENALNIVFAILLVDHFDVFGLGLAFSLAYLISAVVALFMMQRKSLGFSANSLLAGLIPILISAGVMAICVRLGSMLFTNHDSAVGLNAAMQVLCGSLIGVTIYVAMLYLFQVSEMRKLFHRH
jgi:putative peptidoglycan lipid II flippase